MLPCCKNVGKLFKGAKIALQFHASMYCIDVLVETEERKILII